MITVEFTHKDMHAAKQHAIMKDKDRNGAFSQRNNDPLRDQKGYLSELAFSTYLDEVGYTHENHPPVKGNVGEKWDKRVECNGGWLYIDVKSSQGIHRISQYQKDKAKKNYTMLVYVHMNMEKKLATIKGYGSATMLTNKDEKNPFMFEGKPNNKYIVDSESMRQFKNNNMVINRLWYNRDAS